jgi:large subunit ribosomal protein L47
MINFPHARLVGAASAYTVHFSPASTGAQYSSETMASIHNRILRPGSAAPRTSEFVTAFLAPSARCTRNAPAARFSTSPIRCKKDNNSMRGLSAVRRTGLRPRQTLSVKQKDFENQQLPTPVPIEEKVTGTPDHGLWDFFKDQKLLQTPVADASHGA